MSDKQELPDTSDAAARVVLQWNDDDVVSSMATREECKELAAAVVKADRKALADAGYEIVKVGTVPSWMEQVTDSVPGRSPEDGCGGRKTNEGHHYRLSPTND